MAPATPSPGLPSPGTPSPGTPRRDPAAELLARPADPAYLASWGRSLESLLPSSDAHNHLPAVLVRLGEERFLVPTSVVREVHLPRPVHRVPGRSGAVFRGIVCLRGEVLLCGDLFALLGVARAPGVAPSRARMLVLERDGQRWAVTLDEVLDVRRFDVAHVVPAQATAAPAAARAGSSLVPTHEGPATRLDPGRLFEGLARSLA